METIRSNQLIKKKKKVPAPITCPRRKHTAQRKEKVAVEVTASASWGGRQGGETSAPAIKERFSLYQKRVPTSSGQPEIGLN